MFYIGLILCNEDHKTIIFQTRKAFEKYDGRKVQFNCISNNQRISGRRVTIDFNKSIIALNYMLYTILSLLFDTFLFR